MLELGRWLSACMRARVWISSTRISIIPALKMEMENPSISLKARAAASVSAELQRASVYTVEPSRGR